MSVYALIFYLLFNVGKDSVPVFKYLSSQDTILVLSSDIIEMTEYKTNTVYYLSDDALQRICAIKDKNGTFYYYLKNDKMWVFVQQIDYYAEYIPYGYHVVTYNNTILIENHYINLGYRIPSAMINSKGHIKQQYKRLLQKPYDDSQFTKIINQSYPKYHKSYGY